MIIPRRNFFYTDPEIKEVQIFHEKNLFFMIRNAQLKNLNSYPSFDFMQYIKSFKLKRRLFRKRRVLAKLKIKH